MEKEKKRKKAIEKVDMDAGKRDKVSTLNDKRFCCMQLPLRTILPCLVATTERLLLRQLALRMARLSLLVLMNTSRCGGISPLNNRPGGRLKGALLGAGTRTVADVAYDKACDDGPTALSGES